MLRTAAVCLALLTVVGCAKRPGTDDETGARGSAAFLRGNASIS